MRINRALHLTPAQLYDLLNWLHPWGEVWKLSALVVVCWPLRRFLEVERWAEAQLALHKIVPVEVLRRMTPHNIGGRHPGEVLPPELYRFQVFRHQAWKKWPRPWQESA